jgi:hypothetical protein
MSAPIESHQNKGIAFKVPHQFPPRPTDQSHEVGCQSSRGLLSRKQAVKGSHMIKTKSDKDGKKDDKISG